MHDMWLTALPRKGEQGVKVTVTCLSDGEGRQREKKRAVLFSFGTVWHRKCTCPKINQTFKGLYRTGLRGKDKFSPGQRETDSLCLSHAPIFPLPCAPLAISLLESPLSIVPLPFLSPLFTSVSLWEPTADREGHHLILTSTRGQTMGPGVSCDVYSQVVPKHPDAPAARAG